MFAMLFLLLSSVSQAGDAPRFARGPQKISIPKVEYKAGRIKNRRDLRHYNHYSSGQMVGIGGAVVTGLGLGVAGVGMMTTTGFDGATGIEMSGGMGYATGAVLTAGSLMAAAGAIGAAKAVDGARKRPVPQVAGTVGMLFAGSSVALLGTAVATEREDFALIGGATATVGTLLAAGQLAQNASSAPRRWPSIWVDASTRQGGVRFRM